MCNKNDQQEVDGKIKEQFFDRCIFSNRGNNKFVIVKRCLPL